MKKFLIWYSSAITLCLFIVIVCAYVKLKNEKESNRHIDDEYQKSILERDSIIDGYKKSDSVITIKTTDTLIKIKNNYVKIVENIDTLPANEQCILLQRNISKSILYK